ncbi:hypothetical protein MRI28_24230 [Nocardiopsis dassonvillei]|uniref:hypothetical protein n=1 Tax=Nocardiopsis dassonvillei TaxID=2014 RepID=UPI00200E544D|nr:hypothetical protein [Nocardiopsis dassonvillei]MCK9872706.1 hypothetical protein [Nocardiopsis dassonvillei]
MKMLKKALTTAAATGFLMASGVAVAGPAAANTSEGVWTAAADEPSPSVKAAAWLGRSLITSTTNRRIEREDDFANSTFVQIRTGTYGGVRYGWGRIVNALSDEYIRFEVDTNGDRVPDYASYRSAATGPTQWTAGYPVSSSSNVAFRSCLTLGWSVPCNGQPVNTGWW